MTDTTTNRIAGTADGEINSDYVFFTRRVRVPRVDILAVQPSRDGRGATVVTKRGAMRVYEDYGMIVAYLYDTDVSTPEGGAR